MAELKLTQENAVPELTFDTDVPSLTLEPEKVEEAPKEPEAEPVMVDESLR